MTDFTIDRGDDRTFDLAIRDAAGVIINLTGAELWFTLRRRFGDTAIFLQKEIGSGITVDNASGGLCHVDIAAADTDVLPDKLQVFLWDLQMRLDDKISTLDKGVIRVDPDVTQGAP